MTDQPLPPSEAPPDTSNRRTLIIVAGIAAVILLCACFVVVAAAGILFLSPAQTSTIAPVPPTAGFDEATPAPPDSGDIPGGIEVEEIPIQGANHMDIGEEHDPYNSDPPTSGPHYDTPVEAGLYEEVIEDEYLVHNLEHGYVIIWYDCDDLSSADCDALKEDIESIIDQFNGYKVIGMPRSGMETLLALTSWGRLARLDTFDEAFIATFIQTYQNQAPEPNAP